jgi:uncharacterized protein
MISRLSLSLILPVAGVAHLLRPEFFDPAIPFPWKWEINLFSGILEICLAIFLWVPKFNDRAARASALWFLLLIPIHVYVCVKNIPIFGVSHPLILWGRTFFQPVLYFWALSLQRRGWIMSQRWEHVVFLHYEVDAAKLQSRVPYPLDLFDGQAIVSIVPFVMSRIRFPFLLPIPGLSELVELNLRTYVLVDGKRAVYFFTLDSNHLPGVLIARWFFALPYRWMKLSLQRASAYEFRSKLFDLQAQVGALREATRFDHWATERYALLTHRGEKNFCGVVDHVAWTLRDLQVISLRDEFSTLLGEDLKAKAFIATACADQLDVRFRPFRKVSR